MKLASRATAIVESETLRLSAELAKRRAAGEDIVSLLEGEPDLPVPERVLAETAAALKAGKTRYSSSSGLAELKAAIAKKLGTENDVAAPAEDILVANGAKQAIYEVLQALCEPGDQVLIPAPCWVTFPEAVKLAGAMPIGVDCRERLDVEALEKACSPKTKAIILNSPNNPTGLVATDDEISALVDLVHRRDLVLISDEAYEGLVYDGRRHVSPASLGPKALARTVTVQTFSKSFAMTGYRVGYAAGPAELIRAAAKIQGHVTGNACTFAQWGAIAALGLGRPHRAAWLKEHQWRRDVAYALALKHFDLHKPQGGLFLWADARKHLGKRWQSSAELAYHLLSAGVAVVPGSACGQEGWLRISFSAREEVLREGFARLERAL